MLIHTSGKTVDHSVDYKQIVKTFEALKDDKNVLITRAISSAFGKSPTNVTPDTLIISTTYIITNRDKNNVVVMNSDKEKNAAENQTATDPTTPFSPSS